MQQQGMNSMNQSNIMMKPPVMISVKDSLYLADMLSWNLLAMKKAHFFAQNTNDATIKAELEKCGQMHQKHYERILNHLNSSTSTQPMQQMHQQ